MKRFSRTLGPCLILGLILSITGIPCSPLCHAAVPPAQKQSVYFPAKGNAWETRSPEALGFDSALLQEAVDFAVEHEWNGPKDLNKAIAQAFSREPFFSIAPREEYRLEIIENFDHFVATGQSKVVTGFGVIFCNDTLLESLYRLGHRHVEPYVQISHVPSMNS